MDLEALERLGRLRDSGVLTDEEFAVQKQQLLGSTEPIESRQTEDWIEPPSRNVGKLLLAGLFVAALAAIGLWAYSRTSHDSSSIEQSGQSGLKPAPTPKQTIVSKPNKKSTEPGFADFPVTVFPGPLKSPTEEQWQGPNWQEDLSEDINFAGQFTVVGMPCGTECSSDWIVDRKDGRMIRAPEGQSDAHSLSIDTRANSNLMKVVWISSKNDGSGETFPPCFSQNFVWTGQAFHPLSKRVEVKCPEG